MNTALIISEIMSNSLEPWKPLLLFIPVRLGINEINRLYFESLKVNIKEIHAICYVANSQKILIYISGLFWAWTMCWSNRWTSKSCPIFSGLYLWWFNMFRSTWDPNCNDSRYKVKSRWRRSRYVLSYRSVLQMAYGSTRSKHIFGKSVLIKVMINLLYIFKLT